MEETNWEQLKLALNNAVWMHAPKTTTLAEAEEATLLAISYLEKCYRNSFSAIRALDKHEKQNAEWEKQL